jgi:hypothetical protein
MKTIIATTGRGEIVAEVTGGRKEALELLLSRRMVGCFLLICTDRIPGKRIDIEWLLLEKRGSREVRVSYSSRPADFGWQYLDHYGYPRTLRETVTEAVAKLRSMDPQPEPSEAPQIHRQAITDSMDLIGPQPKRRA